MLALPMLAPRREPSPTFEPGSPPMLTSLIASHAVQPQPSTAAVEEVVSPGGIRAYLIPEPSIPFLSLSLYTASFIAEIVRSAQPGTSAMVENALALMLFTAQLVFFLLVPGFGTVDFTMLMGMTLLDFSAGAIVMIFAARRDVQYHAA